MGSRRSSISARPAVGRWEVLWLLAVPVLAVSLLLWVSQSPRPFAAEVVASSVSPSDGGFIGDVRWVDEDGVRRVRGFDLTEEQVDSGTVMLVSTDNELRVFDSAQDTGVSTPAVVATAVIALVFAGVVLATLRGFGYVRGTGQPGEMTSDEVKESHAFYWRH